MEGQFSSQDAGDAPTGLFSERLLRWIDRKRLWVLAGVVVLYAVSITARWRVAPDSALSMSLGRSLAEGEGFVYQGEPHKWVEPGLPWVVAASFRMFGEDNYLPLTLFVLACGVAALALAYQLFKLHLGRPGAVVLTTLLAVCETFYRYCYQIVTDMPFLVGLLAVMLAYDRLTLGLPEREEGPPPKPVGAWWDWLSLVAGTFIMCAFRPTIITFLGALLVATAWHLLRGPYRARHVIVAAVVLASVVAFRLSDPRRSTVTESAHREATLKQLLTEKRGFALHRMVTQFVPEMLSEYTPESVLGIELGTGLDEPFSVVLIALGVTLATRRVLWGAWVAATVAQMAFWLPRERYYLPIIPLLLLAMWYAALWLERRLKPPAGAIAFAGVVLLMFVPNLLQDGVFITEQRWRGITRADPRDPSIRPIVDMARVIADKVSDHDIVLAEQARELTYFSRRKVVAPPRSLRQPPTEKQEQLFDDEFRSAREQYVVLPEERKEHHVLELADRLGLAVGPVVATVKSPPVHHRKRPDLTLNRLVPKQAQAGDAAGPTPGSTSAGSPPPATRSAPAAE